MCFPNGRIGRHLYPPRTLCSQLTMPPRPAIPYPSSVACYVQPRSACLSTSAKTRAQIPPESPRYIDIPRPVQPQAIYRPWVKGILPLPRRIYTRDPRTQAKASPAYLAAVTPEPLRDRSEKADPRTKDFVSWKERQSGLRRQNLRQGLIELQHRDERTAARIKQKSVKIRAFNKAARDAPEREDERLTNASVLASDLASKTHGLADPDRDARLAAKRENAERTKALQEEVRRQNLHTLYVNAGNFITTGDELEQTINKVFDDQEQFRNDSNPGLNIWNLGLPETVQELMGKSSRATRLRAIEQVDANAAKTRERMKRITEELTGGKLDEAR